MNFHDIRIRQTKTSGAGTEITVDGKRLNGVSAVHYDVSVDEVPSVDIEVIPRVVNVDALAALGVSINVEDVEAACRCLQLEMRLNSDFREAVVASVGSVLAEKDSKPEIAEAIVERVFLGEDICWRQ